MGCKRIKPLKLPEEVKSVGQTIEDRSSNPIRVDTDINGKKFAKPIAGPLADIQQGKNAFEWEFKYVQ